MMVKGNGGGKTQKVAEQSIVEWAQKAGPSAIQPCS